MRYPDRFHPSRRDLVGGLAAAALLPRTVPAGDLRARLDCVAAMKDPEAMLAALPATNRSGLDGRDSVVEGMVRRGLAREVALRRTFPFGKPDGSSPYVVSARHGAWLESGDREARLDAETLHIRADAVRGILPPRFLLDSLIARQIASRPSPALVRQTAALAELRARAADSPGIWQLPGGPAYHARRLRTATGTDLSPRDVDRRVGAEIAVELARADRLLRRLGLGRGSVGARLRTLKARPGLLYANDETGRIRAVAEMNAALERLRPQLPNWFNPPFEAGASVKRMSPADEAAARRGYRDPPTATVPGTYRPDLSQVRDRPGWTLTTVAFHETVPGHLLQLRRQVAADPHPLQLRFAPGYSEGWAIYAESFADRIGLLSDLEQLGFIQSWLFRLARVAADIGLHVHRWSREQAVSFLRETVGFELFFPFNVEVERYCIEPAGFAGDAVAALAIRRRGLAAVAAGARAARAMHDRLLNWGPLSAEAIERL